MYGICIPLYFIQVSREPQAKAGTRDVGKASYHRSCSVWRIICDRDRDRDRDHDRDLDRDRDRDRDKWDSCDVT